MPILGSCFWERERVGFCCVWKEVILFVRGRELWAKVVLEEESLCKKRARADSSPEPVLP